MAIQFSKPGLSHFVNTKKVKVWFIEFYATDPSSGKRQRFQLRGWINKQTTENEKITEGNAYAELIADDLKAGWNPFTHTHGEFSRQITGNRIIKAKTLKECLAECFDIKLKQLTSQDAPRSYRYIYNHFTNWLENNGYDCLRPEDFNAGHAVSYGYQLTKEGKKGRGFNNYRSVMKVFFNMLVESEVIYKNPITSIKPAKVSDADIVPFQEMELQIIREYLKEHDPDLYVYCSIIFYTFLRPIEILRLQAKHIDLTRGIINLKGGSSKNSKIRNPIIPPPLKEIIRPWFKPKHPNDYLFGHGFKTGPNKLKMRNAATERHAAVVKALNFEGKLSLYSWKYAGIINAYIAGISMEEIRVQAGHHSIEITQGYMTKLGLIKPSSFGTINY